jgi:hypothetical protein
VRSRRSRSIRRRRIRSGCEFPIGSSGCRLVCFSASQAVSLGVVSLLTVIPAKAGIQFFWLASSSFQRLRPQGANCEAGPKAERAARVKLESILILPWRLASLAVGCAVPGPTAKQSRARAQRFALFCFPRFTGEDAEGRWGERSESGTLLRRGVVLEPEPTADAIYAERVIARLAHTARAGRESGVRLNATHTTACATRRPHRDPRCSAYHARAR